MAQFGKAGSTAEFLNTPVQLRTAGPFCIPSGLFPALITAWAAGCPGFGITSISVEAHNSLTVSRGLAVHLVRHVDTEVDPEIVVVRTPVLAAPRAAGTGDDSTVAYLLHCN